MSVRFYDSRENFTINRAALAGNTAAQLQSLSTMISPPLRQQFSKKLFGGDAAAFESLLAQLETAPNWRTAHRVLDHYFYQRQISPYANDATRFSDLVYKRYFPLD